jgi:hypothetical protein
MNLSALTFKRIFLAFSLTLAIMLPLSSYGQDSFYKVTGTVINGLQFKSIQLILLEGKDRAVSSTTSDSLGRFTFTGLRSGRYKLVNSHYKIDTAMSITEHSIDNFVIMLNVCEVDGMQAEQDIKRGKAKLLLAGGLSPIYYFGQEAFEKKYRITYYEYGCMPPDEKCVMEYNKAIFAYLDKQYGKKWRKEVRKDVIGYK